MDDEYLIELSQNIEQETKRTKELDLKQQRTKFMIQSFKNFVEESVQTKDQISD